jgi:hypothetical protein
LISFPLASELFNAGEQAYNYQLSITQKANHSDATGSDIMSGGIGSVKVMDKEDKEDKEDRVFKLSLAAEFYTTDATGHDMIQRFPLL